VVIEGKRTPSGDRVWLRVLLENAISHNTPAEVGQTRLLSARRSRNIDTWRYQDSGDFGLLLGILGSGDCRKGFDSFYGPRTRARSTR